MKVSGSVSSLSPFKPAAQAAEPASQNMAINTLMRKSCRDGNSHTKQINLGVYRGFMIDYSTSMMASDIS